MRESHVYKEFVRETERKAMEKSIPIYGIFELTGRCNLDCKMCYVHVMDATAAKQRELSTEQWLSIFDEAYSAGMMFATLTGGECLLRPDFQKLYLHLWNKGVKLSVFTNGALISDEYVAFFQKYKPVMIQISLYGSNDAGYERVTGHRAFEKVEHAIRKLEEAEIHLKIAVTPSKYMLEDLSGILHYIKNNKLNAAITSELIEPRDEIEREDYKLSMDEYVQFLRERRTFFERIVTPCGAVPEAGGGCTEVKRGLPCFAGRIRSCIGWDGYMSPCMALPEVRENVLEMGFAKAWEMINHAALEAHNPVECEGCVYGKRCSICPAIRSGGISKDHCRPSQCERVKRLYAEGLI